MAASLITRLCKCFIDQSVLSHGADVASHAGLHVNYEHCLVLTGMMVRATTCPLQYPPCVLRQLYEL
jgi:hypothetical protein